MNDIQLISVDPVTNIVTFGIVPKQISGISKLIQIVVISLMNIPGQDVLNPSQGGGIPALLGSNIDPDDPTEVQAELVRLITLSETQIIANQVGVNDPPEELLSEIQLISISAGANVDQIMVTIRIINQANQSANVTL